eukprot:snap_masked-scaffold_1-processed-gene-25.46-mRNA-1 protein AED:1.00 eAED:1.00 QI:0/0/0/0/1/1/2/0/413
MQQKKQRKGSQSITRSQRIRFDSNPVGIAGRNSLRRNASLTNSRRGSIPIINRSFSVSSYRSVSVNEASFVKVDDQSITKDFRTAEISRYRLEKRLLSSRDGHTNPLEIYKPRNVDLTKISSLKELELLSKMKNIFVKDAYFTYNLNIYEDSRKQEEEMFAEFGAISAFHHENLLFFKESILFENFHFVIYEYFPAKGSLYDIKVLFSLSHVEVLVHFIRQLLSVLSYLHEKNFVLRKLTASNVLIGEEGTIKVIRLNKSVEIVEFSTVKELDKYFDASIITPYSIKYNKNRFLRACDSFKDKEAILRKLKKIKVCDDIYMLGVLCYNLVFPQKHGSGSHNMISYHKRMSPYESNGVLGESFDHFMSYCLNSESERKSCIALLESELLSETETPGSELLSHFVSSLVFGLLVF